MVGSGQEPCQIYLWRLDTQEMGSFSHYFDDYPPYVIPYELPIYQTRLHSGDMGHLCDWLKSDLGDEACINFRCKQCLSIMGW